MKFEGVYGIGHIVYLAIALILYAVGLIFLCKHKNDEKVKFVTVKISAAVLLICIIASRFSVAIKKENDLKYLLPNTFCGLSSLVLSIAVLFGKRDNCVLHCIAYLGMLGGTITIFYPDFLIEQSFFDILSITGLLHHAVMVWLVMAIIKTGYLKPSIKKWFYYPLGLCVIMTLGIFESDCLKFTNSMQINNPLLSSAPIFTSWYVVGTISILLLIIFLYLYEKFFNKTSQSENI